MRLCTECAVHLERGRKRKREREREQQVSTRRAKYSVNDPRKTRSNNKHDSTQLIDYHQPDKARTISECSSLLCAQMIMTYDVEAFDTRRACILTLDYANAEQLHCALDKDSQELWSLAASETEALWCAGSAYAELRSSRRV